MKLRIPRRIKIEEEESSESESEAASNSSTAHDEPKDKAPETSKTTTVSRSYKNLWNGH